MSKFSNYSRKYCKNWEKSEWAQGWLIEQSDPRCSKDAFCKVCKIYLRAHKADLIKHTKTTTHKHNFQRHYPTENKQSLLTSHGMMLDNAVKKEADIKLAVYIAMHSSIQSIDHLSKLLNELGQGSTLDKMRLHRTKCSSLIKHIVAPCLFEDLKRKLQNVPFSLIVDESTDCSITKYLCLCVKYYDTEKEAICINFLAIIVVESTTANELFSKIENYIVRDLGLSLNNLIGIGTDGANNLCGKNHSLFSILKAKNPNIQLVRCICHSLDNAASSAVEEMPAAIEFLCREVYNWFAHSFQRRIQYRRLYDILNKTDKKFHNFVQLSNTRWLARYKAVNTIIEHWDELKLHFTTVVDKEKCYSARVLCDMLNDNLNILSLKIVHPVIFEINKLNLVFQKNEVDIGKAYNDITHLIFFLAGKIFRSQFLTGNVNTISENYDNPLAFVSANEADFGIQYIRALEVYKLNSSESKRILQTKCFNYIKRILGEILKRLPDNLKYFKQIQVFSPEYCLNQANRCAFKNMPFLHFVKEKDMFLLENEYNTLIDVNWKELYGTNVFENSYKFWPKVLNHKNAGGAPAFQNVALFVLKILSLPSSNAIVERVFSIMNLVKTKSRNKLQVEMLSSILRIKVHLYSENKCCQDFKVTVPMLQKFNSNIMYSNKSNENDEIGDGEVMEMLQEFDAPCLNLM